MYPIGASNQTYNTFPSAPAIGTLTPQSRSRVIARGCKPSPLSIQLLHCPYTLGFQLLCESMYALSFGDNLSKGKNQFFVCFRTGLLPLNVDFGSIRSVGFNDDPHFSH